MRLGSSIGTASKALDGGSYFPWEYLGRAVLNGDYSTDLCKHTSSGIFARREILRDAEPKQYLDMESLVPAPRGLPVNASEFGGACP
jgi:hypothetical protein